MTGEKVKMTCNILDHQAIAKDIYSLWLKSEVISTLAKPGQFVSLYCKNGSRLLPRPISLCEVDKENGRIRLVYRTVGKGTKEIASYKVGDTLEVLGPLGNGFKIEKTEPAIIVAGGIGIPPMLELCKDLQGDVHIFLGYRDQVFLAEAFEPYGKVYIATENGQKGHQGNVLTLLEKEGIKKGQIYACGPKGLLKAIQQYSIDNKMSAQLSLEEKMACGVGACLGCVCETTDDKNKHKCVCKEGPVFSAEEVLL